MWFSRIFFRVITACPVIIAGDLLILGMVVFVIYVSGSALSSCIIADLRGETISTIIIAWGVLLESREDLLGYGSTAGPHSGGLEARVTSESKRSGLLLVILGLLLEIITYFDASSHIGGKRLVLETALHGVVWMLLVVVCVELGIGCLNLARIRFKGDTHAKGEA